MKKHRIYVDTSVIGGCCDPEFETWSRGLLRDFQEGTFRVVISEIVEREIASAPDEVKDYYLLFLEYATDVIEVDMEAIELAEAYIRHRILPRSFIDDARHIAVATVAAADLLVSWNFKHIVHFEKIMRFNAVNLESGYREISIFSPREVARHVD